MSVYLSMEESILNLFGKRLKSLRLSKHLTQDDFAKKCGLHKNYIGIIERGERNPSLINIDIIAKALEISIPELFKF